MYLPVSCLAWACAAPRRDPEARAGGASVAGRGPQLRRTVLRDRAVVPGQHTPTAAPDIYRRAAPRRARSSLVTVCRRLRATTLARHNISKKIVYFHLQEFEKRNVKLLGISCEDVGQLNVWAEDVRALYKLEEFPITLLADEDRKVAFQ